MPLSPETIKKYRKMGITARKYGGDDAYSWAVFLHGMLAYSGLSRDSVNYYKGLVYEAVLRNASCGGGD
jgi:hypothetical protein